MTRDTERKRVDLLLVCPLSGWGSSVPLGVMSIAAFVRSRGYSVNILADSTDELKTQLDQYDLENTLVGFSALTNVVHSAIELCAWIKDERSPGAYLAIGGFHATTSPLETMEKSRFDLLVYGEGEETTLEALKCLKENKPRPFKILGSYERTADGAIISSPPRGFIKDLDSLPRPAYDLVDFNYWKGFIRTRDVGAKRVAILLTSRGCPFDCVFCSSKNMWERKLRGHSIEYSCDMIEEMVDRYNLDGVAFLDDELVVNRKRIKAMCEELVKRGLHKKIVWEAQATVTSSDEETFRMMQKAGCRLVRFGLESGSEKILRFLKKGAANIEKNRLAIEAAYNAGLAAFGSFIIGSPEETIDDIVETINFIVHSKLSGCAVFVAVPYPGTELHDICKDKGYLKANLSYADYVVESKNPIAIIRNERFTPEQLTNIRWFIEVNVVEPLNNGKPIQQLDYKSEIEKIMAGDLSMTRYSATHKLKKLGGMVMKGLQNPARAIRYVSGKVS